MNNKARRKAALIRTLFLVCLFLFSSFAVNARPAQAAPAEGRRGMVASAHLLATRAGLEILKKGGNAVDAAVATAFALGVVEPYASGIGGGGFMLVYMADKGRVTALDYRETAPAKVSEKIESFETRAGPRSIAVPGALAGLAKALADHGTMDLHSVLAPAIKLAENGFPANSLIIEVIEDYRDKLSANPEAAKNYLEPGYREGDVICQKDLAKTYRAVAAGGAQVFYRGEIAAAVAKEVQSLGGWLDAGDLAGYRAIAREPVRGRYRGNEIFSMPPPSSGGVHVIELLNILEGFDLAKLGQNSAQAIQVMAEGMRRVFRDRSLYMGDPDFVNVPVKALTSCKYAEEIRNNIHKGRLNDQIKTPDPKLFESSQTTHVSVADEKGNLAALTQTLNSFFGSGIVVQGTGIILNNEMNDFGGWQANEAQPGKRPVSNMSPTIVLKEGKPYMSIGMAGATRIISGLPQIVINIVDYGMDIQAAITAPKFYCSSEKISLESRIGPATRSELEKMGYTIDARKDFDIYFGGAQGVMIDRKTGTMYGGADPRREACAEGY